MSTLDPLKLIRGTESLNTFKKDPETSLHKKTNDLANKNTRHNRHDKYNSATICITFLQTIMQQFQQMGLHKNIKTYTKQFE